jgi:hypothetical protein
MLPVAIQLEAGSSIMLRKSGELWLALAAILPNF